MTGSADTATPVALPPGLAEMAPGPELAAALATTDPQWVSGADSVVLLQAWSRQRNHVEAQFLAAVDECARSVEPHSAERAAVPADFASEEPRAALVWSREVARRRVELARALRVGLPTVFSAMRSGALDEPRARAFVDGLRGVDPAVSREVVSRLLPEAPALLLGVLIARIRELVLVLDPDAARRAERDALAERRVVARRNRSGTATIAGEDLPLERVVRASARIEALAARAKRRGVRAPIDQVRADLFAGLIDGRFEGLDDDEVLELFLYDHHCDAARAPGEGDDDGGDEGDGGDGGGPGDRPPGPRSGPDADARLRGRGELRVALSTLLELDERPGELCGWGPVDAPRARALVAEHTAARWRWAITGDDGHAIATGLLRSRDDAATRRRGWIEVEIAVPATLLRALDPADHPPWSAVLHELRSRMNAPPSSSPPLDGRRRFARAGLARTVRQRDRHCVGPACRTPAHATQLDHTRAHADDGLTTEANLGCLCARHHRLKSEAGWRLEQPSPGHFVWTSPLGVTYRTEPDPVLRPLPSRRGSPDQDGPPGPHEPPPPYGHPEDHGDTTGGTTSMWAHHADREGVRLPGLHPHVDPHPPDAPPPF